MILLEIEDKFEAALRNTWIEPSFGFPLVNLFLLRHGANPL